MANHQKMSLCIAWVSISLFQLSFGSTLPPESSNVEATTTAGSDGPTSVAPSGLSKGAKAAIIAVCVIVAVCICCTVIGLILICKRRQGGYRQVPTRQKPLELGQNELTESEPIHEELTVLSKTEPMPEEETPTKLVVLPQEVPIHKEESNGEQASEEPIQEDLTDEELAQDVLIFSRKLTGRHCRRLVEDIGAKELQQKVEKIIDENQEVLFDTQQMIIDWLGKQKCCNKDKKRHLEQIRTELGRRDLEDPNDVHRVCDDDIAEVVAYLTVPTAEKLCDHLGIAMGSDLTQTLREWRASCDSRSNQRRELVSAINGLSELNDSMQQLISEIEQINVSGQSPPSRVGDDLVYRAEIFDIAFNIFLQDVLPFARSLAVNESKLIEYRRQFSPEHLEKGTILLVAALLSKHLPQAGEDEKAKKYGILRKFGHLSAARSLQRDVACSYSEIDSMAEALLTANDKIEVEPAELDFFLKNEAKITKGVCKASWDETSIEQTKLQVSLARQLGKGLDLAEAEIENIIFSPASNKFLAMLHTWKKRIQPAAFYYRSALSDAIRSSLDEKCHHVADNMVAGKFCTKKPSMTFIRDMVGKMDDTQQRDLRELLGFQEKQGDQDFSDIVGDWLEKWVGEMKPSLMLLVPMVTAQAVAKKHRDLNDQLVGGGFLYLAREAMVMEQNIM